MTGYRVCLDCDRKIPARGDAEHQIVAYDNGGEYMIGCEGYHHRELENAIIGNAYRLQDEDGIIQLETLEKGFETIEMDPTKLAFIVDNNNGQVVTVWMRDTVGIGDVWIYHTSPAYKELVDEAYRRYQAAVAEASDGYTVPLEYRDEAKKLIEGRGGEKLYERLVESVWDYIADNCSYPFSASGDEDEQADELQDFAWDHFVKTYMRGGN